MQTSCGNSFPLQKEEFQHVFWHCVQPYPTHRACFLHTQTGQDFSRTNIKADSCWTLLAQLCARLRPNCNQVCWTLFLKNHQLWKGRDCKKHTSFRFNNTLREVKGAQGSASAFTPKWYRWSCFTLAENTAYFPGRCVTYIIRKVQPSLLLPSSS